MSKIKLYTKSWCPYCRGALSMLDQLDIKYTNIDVTDDYSKLLKAQEKEDYRTIPMIYVDNKFIGGFTELRDKVENGEFEKSTNPKK